MITRPPISTLFPYTTLFRSNQNHIPRTLASSRNARRVSWSPPSLPGFSFVRDRHRTVPPARPWLASGVLRERIPYSRYPVRHRQEIALGHSARTNSRDAKLPPAP